MISISFMQRVIDWPVFIVNGLEHRFMMGVDLLKHVEVSINLNSDQMSSGNSSTHFLLNSIFKRKKERSYGSVLDSTALKRHAML